MDGQGAVELALPVQPVQYTVTSGNHYLIPQTEDATVRKTQTHTIWSSTVVAYMYYISVGHYISQHAAYYCVIAVINVRQLVVLQASMENQAAVNGTPTSER